MKLWVDDLRPVPDGYIGVKSVNEAISWIQTSEKIIHDSVELANGNFTNRNFQPKSFYFDRAERWSLELIDLDHDAGDYAWDGGDYIRLLDLLEETRRNYPIRIHSMNPVGVLNMRRVIERNQWKEIR